MGEFSGPLAGAQSALSNQQSAGREQSAFSNQQSAKNCGSGRPQDCRRDASATKGGGRQRYKPGDAKSTNAKPADVLYLSVENSPERVVRPRFDALGGDPACFHLLQGVLRGTNTGEILARARLSDLTVLGEAIKRTGARLVIVDPLQSYLDAEMNRTVETRPVMDGLCGLAQEHGCAVLLIRHLSKAGTGRAVARGMGSIDLTGAVRSEMLAGYAEGAGAVVHVKSNVGELGPALGYAIDGDGRFHWTGESTLTAAALLAADKEPESATALAEAEDFLRQELGNSRVLAEKVSQDAKLNGIAQMTLRRAKERLGVVSQKDSGPTGAWFWEWPGRVQVEQVSEAIAAAGD